MKTIAIIGGGASGLIASIYASKNNNVILIEKNENCAKKILVTGNGKCNYWNSDQELKHYHSSNIDFIDKVNTEENQKEILKFFEKIGIVPFIKNGYYYPFSGTASSIKSALLLQAKINNVEIKEDCLVNEISKNNNTFCIKTNKGTIIVDKVILATGSLAYYKDEHSNIGYEIAKKFGHTIIKVLPSLVQLKGEEKYFKDWMGIRNNVEISLYEETKFVKKEEGEILLTDYGISGICVFNISGEAAKLLDKKKNVKVKINFVPWIKEDLIEWMNKRNFIVQERKIDELLEGFLNYKLVHVLLKIANIDKNKKWSNLTIKEQNELIEKLQNFTLNITGTNSFDKAQICSGGIDTQEINPKTMESLIVKGLYFAGEIIDVDGDCGGYNLSFAWQSGMIAGRSAGDDVD